MNNTKFTVVLDHADFVVINKPCDTSVQTEQQDHQSSLLVTLCKQLNVQKLWLVHRLDKVTSGLLILAKSAESAAYLSGLFATRSIEKYYLALSDSKPKKKQGLIAGDMAKARAGAWKLTPSVDSPAVTQFFSSGLGDGVRLFILKPRTGKTHQLRVALKSLSSPILGDELYKGTSSDRTYLHAYGLKFTYHGQEFALTAMPETGAHFTDKVFIEIVSNTIPWQRDWPSLPPKFATAPDDRTIEQLD